jgi:hypothetical protein
MPPPNRKLLEKRRKKEEETFERREAINETLYIWREQPTTKRIMKYLESRRNDAVSSVITGLAVATTQEQFLSLKGLSGIIMGLNELLELDADTLINSEEGIFTDEE